MAQHDFVPAWLNFSTPQSAKSPAATFEKHGEHLLQGEGRFGLSRRRHNSSDGFFNNGPLRTTGDCWHQPSLHRHDSVDSGVSKGAQLGLSGNQQSWHTQPRSHDGMNQRGGNSGGGGTSIHRHWNGNVPARKNNNFQEKQLVEAREEKKEEKSTKLQFEEDFPSLNPEAGKQSNHKKPAGIPSGVWENPPSAKQPTKMLVIKKISKEDPSAFSAAFASPIPHFSNGSTKITTVCPIVYKNLVPKPVSPASKNPTSITPPIEISTSRLTRLTRRSTDRKSEFLRALKDDSNGDIMENRECDKLEEMESSSPTESEESGHHNGLTSHPDETNSFSLSLEAEHRLLKEMGWQENPDNEESYLPLTEEELREFQLKSEQLRRSSFQRNGSQRTRCSDLSFIWRSTLQAEHSKESDTETSSSETSDDDA
uniref:Vasculin-like protein 1 n=1 Tax=Geotrypetes seraphini TaxID=260995 RepID=A0A6P8N6Y3_GEOSA|nr:vasculin-like protein 1 [Geotrypetes seraphini]XP_033771292.1 vasculin-like protein 1 [Geotrypetes seraphini]XP_033771293.1 vasculin-like protein 1 [Geotrypetes seraphini]XP_033771294.1 vasculin-like protein 1 [Geotrypetes seraphini]XP_033771295.1 vasculin-like protein 1 [Geotrypetes seraphini]XP_033771297.1 vasculin-like protein 1 [Geotrypetes seraphini]XP_033771298.1 vasculin-like protein 1 [Geotrypetes seraphini]XP_033771299.1 vasculin-like protein 1 [Geotrypetes seraphini]